MGATKRIGVEIGQLLGSRSGLPPRSLKHLPHAKFSDVTALVNWQRDRQSRRGTRLHAEGRRLVERMHSTIADNCEWDTAMRPGSPISTRRRCAMMTGWALAGDYPADRAALAPGRRCLGLAPHLTWERTSRSVGRGHFLRDRRRSTSAIPLPAVAHACFRWASPTHDLSTSTAPRRPFLKAWTQGLRRRQGREISARASPTPSFKVLGLRITKDNRTGYPIGLSYPPDWGERTNVR